MHRLWGTSSLPAVTAGREGGVELALRPEAGVPSAPPARERSSPAELPAPLPPVRPAARQELRQMLTTRRSLRRAIVLQEVLGPPKALRPM